MADINHVTLVGRLTRDAELKYTNSGLAVCKFSLAINRRRKNGDQWVDEAHFFDVVLMGRTGEAIHRYLQKGKQVGVEGELRQSRWEHEGQTRSRVEIFAINVQLLGGAGGGSGGGAPRPAGGAAEASQDGPDYSSYGGEESSGSFEDDVPF
ncbi:MAG TPA: single-stranded DNA-binding protein [Spirochaetia bacterium]|nr:single-stranded DNA-binding protein [Spirochaetia bacterium]